MTKATLDHAFRVIEAASAFKVRMAFSGQTEELERPTYTAAVECAERLELVYWPKRATIFGYVGSAWVPVPEEARPTGRRA